MSYFDLLSSDNEVVVIAPSKRSVKKAKKQIPIKQIKTISLQTTMRDVYDLEELWLIVLEYLPVAELFSRIGLLDHNEFERVNSNEFITTVLKRDCEQVFKLIDNKTKFKIINGVDKGRFFQSVVESLNPKSKFDNISKTNNYEQFNCKALFKNIYKQLLSINKDLIIQEENRSHHARIFITKELAKKKITDFQKKQLECLHLNISKSSIESKHSKYTYLFKCESCGIGMETNFLPENIYVPSKEIKFDFFFYYPRTIRYSDPIYNFQPEKHFFRFVGL